MVYKNKMGGVIMVPREIEDKLFGGENSIGGKVLLETGDYKPYLTTFELQKKNRLDTYGCLTFSGLNASEIEWKIRRIEGDKVLLARLEEIGMIDENGNPK